MKVLLNSFHLNGHTLSTDSNLELHFMTWFQLYSCPGTLDVGANGDSPWWTALKALLFPGVPWCPPGDPLLSWDCERWWLPKSTDARSFLPCLETSAPEGFKYSGGTSLKKYVLLGSNWNRSAAEKRLYLTHCSREGGGGGGDSCLNSLPNINTPPPPPPREMRRTFGGSILSLWVIF